MVNGVPGKLVVVVVLIGLGILVNLLSGALLSAGIQGALLFGVLVGNDGVRTLLRVVAALNILTVVVMSVPAMQATGSGVVVVAAFMSVGINSYFIWALGQPDVREWMFRKNFKLGEDGQDDGVPKL